MATVELEQNRSVIQRTGLRMTLQEFHADVSADYNRMLLHGELWEGPMNRRNRWHSASEAILTTLLTNWSRNSETNGDYRVFAGDVGWDHPESESSFGIDIAIFRTSEIERLPVEQKYISVVPVLAVEILSPSNTHEEISEKIRHYLDAGVLNVWIVDTRFQTVTVFQPGKVPQLFTVNDRLTDILELSGLEIAVIEIFAS